MSIETVYAIIQEQEGCPHQVLAVARTEEIANAYAEQFDFPVDVFPVAMILEITTELAASNAVRRMLKHV